MEQMGDGDYGGGTGWLAGRLHFIRKPDTTTNKPDCPQLLKSRSEGCFEIFEKIKCKLELNIKNK